MIIKENEYFERDLDVSEEEEYIKIQKYILMRNNAESFLTKHCKTYGGNYDTLTPETHYSHKVFLKSTKRINHTQTYWRDHTDNKILCHTLEMATLQNDVLKILNKKNDRGYIYESELLRCFAYPQYPNKITEQFESDEEIIVPKLVSNLDKFYALAAHPQSYGFFVLLVAICIFLICTYFHQYH